MTWLDRLREERARSVRPPDQLRPKTKPPQVTWIQPQQLTDDRCPNCQSPGPKSRGLIIDFEPIMRAPQTWVILFCSACTCAFYEKTEGSQKKYAQYEADEMLSRGRASLYIQQGAGLSQLLLPLARLSRRPEAQYLDIGCGFGFTLDFASHAKGWNALGIDPGQIASLGKQRLGVAVELREFGVSPKEIDNRYDIIMAAETIEHLSDPVAFLKVVRGILRPDGILVLTTPDAARIEPGTPDGLLATILSPELHTVLQSATSLEWAIESAGFEHLSVQRDGSSLIAFASDKPFCLSDDLNKCRQSLRGYLETRANVFRHDSDLFFGFAGRGLLECANAKDLELGARLRMAVVEMMGTCFRLDLERLNRLPAELSVCGLERMAELIPLNLGSILYATAMLDLLRGVPRPELRGRFALSAKVSRELRRAVSELAMEDALSEDLAWVADSEALLCAAEAGNSDVLLLLPAFAALSPADKRDRLATLIARCFVTMVTSGHHGLALQFSGHLPRLSELDEQQFRDVLFCQGTLQLQPGGNLGDALAAFESARATLDASHPTGLYWPSLRGEVEALRRLSRIPDAVERCREARRSQGERGDIMPADLSFLAGRS